MQVVILAAGRGTRMKDLTVELPKPMLLVAGKTLLERKFNELPPEVSEVIMVIGYQGDKIREYFGDSLNGTAIRYVEQETLDGTGGALWKARPLLKGRFLVMMGDDLYSREDIDKCIATPGWVIGVEERESLSSGGCIITNADGTIADIQEGNHGGAPGFISTNLFALDMSVFDYPLVPKSAGSDEYGLPQSVLAASKSGSVPFTAVIATGWFQVTDPDDLTKAEEWLASRGAVEGEAKK